MAANFIGCDREQGFLLPPSLRDWVPEDHLVWTILGAVEGMDMCDFYADYRADGHGRPAYDPGMMVALLLYAYARGNRSSRGIERECREDVAYRVICANRVPDHSTIAKFRVRHEAALAELFTSVLSLCRRAGWSGSGLSRSTGRRSPRTPLALQIAAMSRSRARSWPRWRRRTGARTSSTASARGSRARRRRRGPRRLRVWRSSSTRRGLLHAPMAGGPGCRRGARRSRSGARWRRGLSHARAPSGSRSRRAGSRRSFR